MVSQAAREQLKNRFFKLRGQSVKANYSMCHFEWTTRMRGETRNLW